MPNVRSEIHLGWRVLPALFTVLTVREDNSLAANLRKENWTEISLLGKKNTVVFEMKKSHDWHGVIFLTCSG